MNLKRMPIPGSPSSCEVPGICSPVGAAPFSPAIPHHLTGQLQGRRHAGNDMTNTNSVPMGSGFFVLMNVPPLLMFFV